MTKFEQMIENMKNNNEVPEMVQQQFQKTLSNLPEQKKQISWKKYAAVAAMFVMCSGVLLAGGSALASKIPFLGKIFAEVENLHFFPGDYDDKAQVLGEEENYVAEDQGIKITASEIYSDGFSIYVTAEIVVEEGGLNNIPGEIARKNMYLMGSYQLGGNVTLYEMENDNLYGTIVDDHTFIGMTKLDLDDVYVEEGVLNWNLSTIGYDDIGIDLEPGISHRIEGEWNLVLPFIVDVENTKTVEVNHSEKGYTLEKVVVTPYQIVTYLERPYIYHPFSILVFNQDGEMLNWQRGEDMAKFSVDKLEVDSIYIYVFENDYRSEIYKNGDMKPEIAEKAVLFVEVPLE